MPDAIDLRGTTFVDVGAGSGQLTAAILAAVPDARAKVMDRDHVLPVARANLASTVGLDRVELTGGDMTKAVPAGGDIYFLCRVLAGWSDDAVVGVFENCRAAMPDESSRLVILERVVVDEKPTVLPALWDLHLLMTNGGKHRTLETYTGLLARAGLRVERVAELPSETTAIIAALYRSGVAVGDRIVEVSLFSAGGESRFRSLRNRLPFLRKFLVEAGRSAFHSQHLVHGGTNLSSTIKR